MPQFNINTDAAVKYTATLERINRTALPVAVRKTLNGMALDAKKNTIPAQSTKDFTNRQKNFFKVSSRVKFAQGFNIDSMQAVVGFTPRGSSAGQKQAVENLEQQEHGGSIGGRSFIPKEGARVSKSEDKLVKKSMRVSTFKKNLIKSRNVKAKNSRQRLLVAAIRAKTLHGNNAFVLHGNTVYKVNQVFTRIKTRDTKIDIVPVYDFKKGRSVKIQKATRFMSKASMRSAKKGDKIFINESKKQINRIRK